MIPSALLFGLVAIACYALAFLTSQAFVRWMLPNKIANELGSQARFVAIDGIRGFLAFSVFVHHCLVTWIFMPNGQWMPVPHNFENQLGATSVAIFFMITAFLFWGRAQAQGGLDLKGFSITRVFRIYPLYLFVLFLICLVVAYSSGWAFREPIIQVAKEVGLWLFFRVPDINGYYHSTLIVKGVTWTLLYEAWFYLSLPLFVVMFLKKNSIWKKVLAIGIVALLFWVNHIEIQIAATFLGGIFAVYWRKNERRVKLAQTKVATIVALACLCAVFFFLYKPFNVLGISLLAVFFAVIVSGNTLFGILKLRAALWLGEISYSIYLCHGLVLWLIMQHLVPHLPGYDHTTKWFIASAIGTAPIVVLFCSATYLFVEKPMIAVGHRLSKRAKVSRTVPLEGRTVSAVQLG